MLAFYRSSVPSFPPSRSPSLLRLAPSHPPLPQSLSFPLPRVPQAGSCRPAQTPPRERGGGHHARDRAGSWGLPPPRPARALPRPGPHAPLLQHAAHWTPGCRGYDRGICGGRQSGPGPGGPGDRRGLGVPGYTGDVGLGPAEVRRSWFRNGELSGTGVISALAWQTVTCHSSTSPRHTWSYIATG